MLLLKQVGVVALGAVVAAVMVALGSWQLGVYHSQGDATAAERASQAPVPLQSVAPEGESVGDAYGRSVQAIGHFDPALQVLVDNPADRQPARVLTGLVQSDGSVVAVVRGTLSSASEPLPAPSTQELTVTGVFLPSEGAASGTVGDGSQQVGSVQLAVLAQHWPRVVSGFITMTPAESTAQGLAPADTSLPEARGRLRNGAYALQWWIFAAFAVAFAVKMAYDLGRRIDDDDLDLVVGDPEEGPARSERDAADTGPAFRGR